MSPYVPAAAPLAHAVMKDQGKARMIEQSVALPRPKLVGRAKVREAMAGASARAHDDGGTILLTGDVGFGKSAILDDFAARISGWTILRLQADPYEESLPFSTVETLIRLLNARSGSRLRVPLPTADGFTVGRSLLGALDRLPEPVCLIIDDAQWLDAASARSFRFLVRRLAHQPFLLVVAARARLADRVPLLDELAFASVHVEDLRLTPLSVPNAQELATHILGHSVSRRTATRLTHATHGSPMLLRALLEQMRDTFAAALHPAGWDAPLEAHAKVSAAVALALDGAPPEVRSAAELVAVVNDPLPVPVLGSIAARLGLAVDLAGAIDRGLIHKLDQDGMIWLEPAHSMIADSLVANVSLHDRTSIHRAAASELTGRAALRHRVEAADRTDEVLSQDLLAASQESADLGESDAAMNLARSALLLAPAGTVHDRCLIELGLLAMRTRLHERIFDLLDSFEALRPSLARNAILVELRILTGNISGALALANSTLRDEGLPVSDLGTAAVSGRTAAPTATATSDEAHSSNNGHTSNRAHTNDNGHTNGNAHTNGRTHSPVGARAGEFNADARAIRAHVAAAIPKIQMATREFGPVLDQIERARALYAIAPDSPTDVSDPTLVWLTRVSEELLWLVCWELIAAGHLQRADLIERAADEVERLSATSPGTPALVDAFVTRARAFILAGDLVRARDDLDRANELMLAFPVSWTSSHGRVMFAHVLYLLGEWDQSVSVADNAVSLALDETDLSGWPVALTVSTLVRAARGEEKAVLERLASAARAQPGITDAYDSDLSHIARAELFRARNLPKQQLEAADAARPGASASSSLGWLSYRIDALATLGRSADARATFEMLQTSRTRWKPYYGSLAWLEGRVNESEGRFVAALACYRRACNAVDSELYPLPLAVALTDLARTLARSGRSSEAARSLSRAVGIFRRLGAGDYLRRAAAELEKIADDGAHAGAPPSPEDVFDRLTSRERQVAHALAAGMTNKEIAEQLYVSVTTVNFHVRNILAKLGLNSRRDLRRLPGRSTGPKRSSRG